MASRYLDLFKVPNGFPEILHDFSRDLIEARPDDLLEYAAQYFEAMRDGIAFVYEPDPSKRGKHQHHHHHGHHHHHDKHHEHGAHHHKEEHPHEHKNQHKEAENVPAAEKASIEKKKDS